MSAYAELSGRFRKIGLFSDISSMLGWDTAVMMPPAAAETRGEQQAALDVLVHERLTEPRLGDLLEDALRDNSLDAWQRANIEEMRRARLHATAVPADLVEAASRTALECEMLWREARPANDFARVLPKLSELLALTRQTAEAKAAAFGTSLYDALLDQYEPGGTSAEIDVLFAELAGFLPGLIAGALEAQGRRPAPIPFDGPFPIAAQEALGRRFMAALGFDFAQGRLDVSHHPFCGGNPTDVRITTRYSEDDFGRALMGVLHETGHALYELGLPAEWRHQPVGSARGMSLHESQSLLFEMQACRSRDFAEFAAPLVRAAFGKEGPAWSAENFNRHQTRVARSLIRVDADEVTYPAHVVLRYRLERALIAGDLALADLPGAWRDGMVELVGIAPPDDRDGCMQDIHWYSGAFGYFPTYTMGAMTAAQLFRAALDANPEIPENLRRGDFSPLLGWLRRNVHGVASSRSARDILIAATGKPLGTEAFRRHLERRYLQPDLAE